MEITNQNTNSDLYAFHRYYYSRSPGIFVLLLHLFIVPIVGTVLIFLHNPTAGFIFFCQLSYYIGISIGELIMLLYILFIVWFHIYRIRKQDSGFFLEHRMELTEEGIRVKNVNSEYFRAWNAVKQMRESKYYFYIFILKRVAIIIPKRVFFSAENMKQFRSTLNLYLKK